MLTSTIGALATDLKIKCRKIENDENIGRKKDWSLYIVANVAVTCANSLKKSADLLLRLASVALLKSTTTKFDKKCTYVRALLSEINLSR